MNVSEIEMKARSYNLRVKTSESPEFVDITEEVGKCVVASGIVNGIAVVFSRHTTAAIVIQENEPLLIEDFKRLLESIASSKGEYRHNDFDVRTVHMHDDECPNGHSHCQHLTLGTSESIPVIDSVMALGEWQRVFMVELDGEKASQLEHREIIVQILG